MLERACVFGLFAVILHCRKKAKNKSKLGQWRLLSVIFKKMLPVYHLIVTQSRWKYNIYSNWA